jgi:hypothetical protein
MHQMTLEPTKYRAGQLLYGFCTAWPYLVTKAGLPYIPLLFLDRLHTPNMKPLLFLFVVTVMRLCMPVSFQRYPSHLDCPWVLITIALKDA